MTSTYRIVPGPIFTPRTLALAPSRNTVESAVADMGEGMVVTADGSHLVAFHEKHLDVVERLAQVGASR